MAARRRRPTSRSRGSSQPGFLSRAVMLGVVLGAGVLCGYLWRSYYPVALPFESALVADKSSTQIVSGGGGGEAAAADLREATRRAERAEREVESLRQSIQDLEADRARAERELADLKIKSVLQSSP